MKRFVPQSVLASALVLSASTPTLADSIPEATLDLCEKVKSCAISQMNQEEVTPEMRQMMEPMLESMCASMGQQVQAVAEQHPLYDSAVACIRSMEKLDCQALQGSGQNSTAACESYEKLLRESSYVGE